MSNAPIFITGSTGFIGKRLTLELANRGEKVRALVRSPKKAADFTHPNISIIKGDLNDKEALRKGLDGCDRLFHLAALAKAWARDMQLFEQINYHSAINLLELAKEVGVSKTVVTSTGGALGHSKNGQLVDESGRAEPHLMTAYEKSKFKLEATIREMTKAGHPVVIVNPSRVYGPGPLTDSNGELIVMQKYIQGSFRFLPGDGSSTGSYGYVDDVVEGHILAMEKGKVGEQYILGGENASFREFFDMIGTIHGKKYKMYAVPIPLLMGFAKFQLFLAENFGRYPLLTPELIRKYTKRWDFSSEKAKKALGYQPRSLEEGMRDTIQWMKQNDLI